MSLDEPFKVESSFPSRTKRSSSAETKPALKPELVKNGDDDSQKSDRTDTNYEDEEDDDGLDLNDFLSSNIVYQSPYTDDDEDGRDNNNINTYNMGPISEEHYSFNKINSPSLLSQNQMTFDNSRWPDFSEWSINLLSQNENQQQQRRLNIQQQLGGDDKLDASVASYSWMNLPVPSMSLNEDDPLIFLKTQESKILSSLNELLVKQLSFLTNGHGKVKKVRSIILNDLNKLHEIHQAMTEIYNSEQSKRQQILKKFEEWENKKKQLLEKINDIQSDSNEEGVRYRQLFDQSNELDANIDELESKLKQLKLKRTIVRKELDLSQSVIESKASSYIESLEVIEQHEGDVISRLSNSDLKSRSLAIPNLEVPTNISAPLSSTPNENGERSMSILKLNLSKLNIGKYFSPNANTPDNNSRRQETKISNLFFEAYKPRVDVSKLINSLNLQIDAIMDEVAKQETASFKFQESSIIWNESIDNVSQMETSLKVVTNDNSELFVLKNLQKTLELLTKRFQTAQKLQLSIAQTAIGNEISTIKKALYIVTKDEIYLQKDPATIISGPNTPSSVASSFVERQKLDQNSTRRFTNSNSSNSSVNKGSTMNVAKTTRSDSSTTLPALYLMNTTSPPAATLATSGPPIILSSNVTTGNTEKKINGYNADRSKRKSTTVFGNLGFSGNKIADKKSVKKD